VALAGDETLEDDVRPLRQFEYPLDRDWIGRVSHQTSSGRPQKPEQHPVLVWTQWLGGRRPTAQWVARS
jgi:hypothetical protein